MCVLTTVLLIGVWIWRIENEERLKEEMREKESRDTLMMAVCA